MWDYLFDIQLNNPPLTKSLPASSSFFTPGRPYAPSRSQLFTARRTNTPYVKHKLQPITLQRAEGGHALREGGAPLPNPREPN